MHCCAAIAEGNLNAVNLGNPCTIQDISTPNHPPSLSWHLNTPQSASSSSSDRVPPRSPTQSAAHTLANGVYSIPFECRTPPMLSYVRYHHNGSYYGIVKNHHANQVQKVHIPPSLARSPHKTHHVLFASLPPTRSLRTSGFPLHAPSPPPPTSTTSLSSIEHPNSNLRASQSSDRPRPSMYPLLLSNVRQWSGADMILVTGTSRSRLPNPVPPPYRRVLMHPTNPRMDACVQLRSLCH